jgi:uncharacterized protein (UPF0264 family)
MTTVMVDRGGGIPLRSAAGGCGLLVSVRDAAEAAEALAGGATIVDVKEPARGALGVATAAVTARIAAVVGDRAAWTLAGGELRDGVETIHDHVRRTLALEEPGSLPPVAAKAGLAGAAGADWRAWLAAFAAGLPAGIAPVAVAYADWERAGSPPPPDVIAAAVAVGCGVLLLDTFDKAGPGVIDPPGAVADVTAWVARARAAGLGVVLGGRLTPDSLPAAVTCGVDVIAVRSAACVGGRSGTVCRKAVQRLGKLCGPAGF